MKTKKGVFGIIVGAGLGVCLQAAGWAANHDAEDWAGAAILKAHAIIQQTAAAKNAAKSKEDEDGVPGWGFNCVPESVNGAPVGPGNQAEISPLRLTINGDIAIIQLIRNSGIVSKEFQGEFDPNYRPTPPHADKLRYKGFVGLSEGSVGLLIDKQMRHAESGLIDLRVVNDGSFNVETAYCTSK